MLYLALTLLTALLVGMRHATDPDHVLAVSAIVSRERSVWRASGVGILWGAGHTTTIFLAGGAIVAFDLTLPAGIDVAFEICVAIMLMLLGARNLIGNRLNASRLALPPFAVGAVHGLAGSAALALLLVPLLREPLWGVLYLLAFGVGTIGGMTLCTYAIAGSTLYATTRVAGLDRWIRLGAGALSVGFGVLLLYGVS